MGILVGALKNIGNKKPVFFSVTGMSQTFGTKILILHAE